MTKVELDKIVADLEEVLGLQVPKKYRDLEVVEDDEEE